MKKCAMLVAAGILGAGVPLFQAGAAGATGQPVDRSGDAVGDAGSVSPGPVRCVIPAFGWADCTVVKALPDDSVDVLYHGAPLRAQAPVPRLDCNLNELNSGEQLNPDTAYMMPGERRPLWHNNTGGTVYAELRCASPQPSEFGADVEAIRW